jgi:hypothetical protein
VSRNVLEDMLTPEEREAKRADTARMLAELRAIAAQSRKERLTAANAELPKVTLRDGPWDGLPPGQDAWGAIPGTSWGPIKPHRTESEGT